MKTLRNQKGFGLIEGLLIVIALTLIAFVGFYVYNANKGEPEISDSSIQHKETETAKEEETARELIDYGEEGILIEESGDVSKLEGASESFKSFIASEIEKLNADEDCWAISVNKIFNDEFASGSGGGDGVKCFGGGQSFWIKADGKWSDNTELGGHEIPLCSEVEEFKVPPQIIEECQDDSNPDSIELPIIKNPNQ